MAKNLFAKGDVIPHTNTSASAIASGDVVVIGSLVGVSQTDIAPSAGTGEVAITKTWLLPKADAAVIAAGERVTWDLSAGNVVASATATAAGDVRTFGVAVQAMAATSGAEIPVRLTPGTGNVAT